MLDFLIKKLHDILHYKNVFYTSQMFVNYRYIILCKLQTFNVNCKLIVENHLYY